MSYPVPQSTAVPVPSATQPAFSPGFDAVTLCRAVIDQLDFGIAIVGRDARIALLNRALEHECAARRFVTIENEHLRAPNAPLSQAIDRALAGLRQMVPLTDGEQTLPAMVSPLVQHAGAGQPLALVVFGRRRLADPIVTEMYARTRRLTGAETAVLRRMGDGCTPKQCSSQSGLALSTVRTQLSSARDKLGVGSIDDMLRMMGCLPPITPGLFVAT